MSIIDQMRVLLREHKEEAEARKAAIKPDPPHVTVPESLCRSTELASWMAYFALVYFLWLYTLDIARDRAASLHLTHLGQWVGDVQFFFPYIVGFAVVAVGIPYVAKIAIPTFTRLSWSEAPTEKAWSLLIAVAVSLVVIAGTFTVQGDTILERDRASVVAVEETQQAANVLQGQITAKEAELRSMMENRNAYLAQAASVGAAEWQRSYIDQTDRNDPQRDRIVRALGAARAADNVRTELADLRQRAATQTTTAAVASRVTTASNSWIASTLGWLEGARAMLLSFVMDIVCLIMPLIALRLRLKRNQQLGMGDQEPAEIYALADLRSARAPQTAEERARNVADVMMANGADPQFAADMARSAGGGGKPKKRVWDNDRQEWVTEVRYFRGSGKKKRDNEGRLGEEAVYVPPVLPDEPGAVDGAARAGSVAAESAADEQQSADDNREEESANVGLGMAHALQPTEAGQQDYGEAETESAPVDADQVTPLATDDLTDEQTLLLYSEIAPQASEAPATIALGSDGADGVMQTDEQHDAHVRAREMEAA